MSENDFRINKIESSKLLNIHFLCFIPKTPLRPLDHPKFTVRDQITITSKQLVVMNSKPDHTLSA